MNETAIITFSELGCAVAKKLSAAMPDSDVFVHEVITETGALNVKSFAGVMELTAEIFGLYRGIIFVAPCGVAVRAIAPLIRHKTTDPAVVVVDVGARWAISLLSGHEGGANGLAARVGNITGAEPVVTTTTEAEKDVIVGVGCKRGTDAARIEEAILSVLGENNIGVSQVRLIASADVKADEDGLIAAAEKLGVPLRFIPSETIRAYAGAFEESEFVMEKVGLPAVAEPAALLAGRRTTLIQRKKKCGGITVAIARESFTL